MLQQVKLKSDLFNKLLNDFPYTRYVKDIHEYKNGYKNKNVIYYNEEYLICETSFLIVSVGEEICKDQEIYASWKQIIVRRDNENIDYQAPIELDFSGSYAKSYLNKILLKKYTKEEIDERLNQFTATYDFNLKQKHTTPYNVTPNYDFGKVIKWKNCYKYDINAAHTWCLIQIFPKCEKEILKMYKHRHDNNNKYKKIINYYVGFLCCWGHRETYNWIVQTITKKLSEFELMVDGLVIYDNTDGCIIQNPKIIPENKDELGEFKLEYVGDVYTYIDKNYYCIQSNELKGSIMNEARQDVDLSKGKVVHYDKVKNIFGIYEKRNAKLSTEQIKEYK